MLVRCLRVGHARVLGVGSVLSVFCHVRTVRTVYGQTRADCCIVYFDSYLIDTELFMCFLCVSVCSLLVVQ